MLDSKEQSNLDDTNIFTKDNHNVDCPTIMTNQISELTTDLLLPSVIQQQHNGNENHYTSVENKDDELSVLNNKEDVDDDNLNSLEIIALLLISLLYYVWNEVTSGNMKRKFRGLLVISIFICICYWNKRFIIIEDM